MDEDEILPKEVRDEEAWKINWDFNIILDPILFWYLMIVIEEYKSFPPDNEIHLSTFTKPKDYNSLADKIDSEVHSETEA